MNFNNVPVFILAGGLGTRLSEETQLKPKPMVEIGGLPILLHLMRNYYSYGFNDFVICAGYKSWDIKQYFLNYEFRINDLEVDHRERGTLPPVSFGPRVSQERWRVRVLDTGDKCMTGGRIARAFDSVYKEEPFENFALTYGDGLCDVNLAQEFEFHRSHGKTATVLGVRLQSRFGVLNVEGNNQVTGFLEKPADRQEFVNGGFFFLKHTVRSYLDTNPSLIFEREPLEKISKDGELKMFHHSGFWQPMDTLRDKNELEAIWNQGEAPWFNRKPVVRSLPPHLNQ